MCNKLKVDVVVPAYNEESKIISCVESIRMQRSDGLFSLSIIVIDDCSDDATASKLDEYKGSISIFRNASRSGRAQSINNGVSCSLADIIIIVDGDCVFDKDNFILAHVEAVTYGAAFLSVSPIKAEGGGFWARYQGKVNSRREKIFLEEGGSALTTACFCMFRRDFLSLGGFSEQYKGYGFEDKDFLLRVEAKNDPKIVLLKNFPAVHSANLSMLSVSRKMKEAGMYSALIFSQKHPQFYKETGFYKFDASVSRVAAIISVFVCEKMLLISANTLDFLIDKKKVPFFIAFIAVKIISALSFMTGTRGRPR